MWLLSLCFRDKHCLSPSTKALSDKRQTPSAAASRGFQVVFAIRPSVRTGRPGPSPLFLLVCFYQRRRLSFGLDGLRAGAKLATVHVTRPSSDVWPLSRVASLLTRSVCCLSRKHNRKWLSWPWPGREMWKPIPVWLTGRNWQIWIHSLQRYGCMFWCISLAEWKSLSSSLLCMSSPPMSEGISTPDWFWHRALNVLFFRLVSHFYQGQACAFICSQAALFKCVFKKSKFRLLADSVLLYLYWGKRFGGGNVLACTCVSLHAGIENEKWRSMCFQRNVWPVRVQLRLATEENQSLMARIRQLETVTTCSRQLLTIYPFPRCLCVAWSHVKQA